MNKLKYVFAFLIGLVIIFSSIEKSIAEIEASLIPKFRPFGTSVYFSDSTNYVNLINDGLHIPNDSLKVGKWIFVGTKGGGIYYDTNRAMSMYFDGYDFYIQDDKSDGDLIISLAQANSQTFQIKDGNVDSAMFKIKGDDNSVWISLGSLFVGSGNTSATIGFTNKYSPNQVKINGGDTSFTDYNTDDAITCNLQSGKLTTKSLTTGTTTFYSLTLTNSLISATSRVFAQVTTNGGNGVPLITQVAPGSGSATLFLYNASGTAALNSVIGLEFFVLNSP